MEFRLLGPLEVRRDGEPVRLGGPRERAVLAALLLRANQLCRVGYLVDMVWERPPASPETNLRTYLSGLRRRLEPDRFVTRPGGYLVTVHPGELDLTEFDRTTAQGQAALKRGATADATEAFGRALRLWRDEPLTGESYSPALRAEVEQLTARRIAAIEGYAQTRLESGAAAELVDELSRYAGQYPLREELWALLIQALYQAGRRPEALDTYTRARTTLVDEVGVEPGPRLRSLHTAILRDEPGTDPAGGPARQPVSGPVVPAQLPVDLTTFTGRSTELDRLTELLGNGAPGTVVISAIDGMAGIGKTTLAIHFAHRIRDRYPDGQLFLDLHGHTEGIDPVEPGDALDRMLAVLGVPGEQIPAGLDDRAALFRSRLADRRVLIVLDNAASERQIQPLIPAAPGCTVLVTSRRRMTGLDDAVPLSLDVLPTPDAVALFTRIAGPDRVAGPAELVRDVVELCGHLPLAIRIAAARLRSRPGWTLVHLADRLGDLRRRLSELELGERSVAAAFTLSYRNLTAHQQRVFRLLGLSPGTDIDRHAAAALVGEPVDRVEKTLEELVDVHLLMQRTPGRYVLHDLLRAHAANTAAEQDSEPDRRAAVTRLLDNAAYTTSVAMAIVYPSEAGLRPVVPVPDTDTARLDDRTAITWLATEQANLLSAASHAAGNGWPRHAIAFSRLLARYLYGGGHHDGALVLHTEARECARQTGDPDAELDAVLALGDCHLLTDRYDQSRDCYQQALSLAERLDDAPATLLALHGLGNIQRLAGESEAAEQSYRRALEVARDHGDRVGESRVLRSLGQQYALRGLLTPAEECFRQALEVAEETADRGHQGRALVSLALVLRRTGRLAEAAQCAERAVGVLHEVGDRLTEVNARNELGRIARMSGRLDDARAHIQRALEMVRGLGDRLTESQVRKALGDVHLESGRIAAALEEFRLALEIARQIDSTDDEFEALRRVGQALHALGQSDQALTYQNRAIELVGGLGQPQDEAKVRDSIGAIYRDIGDPERARTHWRRAYQLYADLGMPQAEQIAAKLDNIDLISQ